MAHGWSCCRRSETLQDSRTSARSASCIALAIYLPRGWPCALRRVSQRLSEATKSRSLRKGASMTTSVQYSLLAGGCMAVVSRLPCSRWTLPKHSTLSHMALPAGAATTCWVPTTMDGLNSFYALFGQQEDHCHWEDGKANLPRARTQVW